MIEPNWFSLCEICVFVPLCLVFKTHHKDTKTQRNHKEEQHGGHRV